ncbi:MAG: helix-turn-helix transcriptional regulator [Oscillospiraceae bacterium]|nr:helix-turn-helix transcriptional regulator [Oscillospiraceae bacterium]
MTRKLLYNGHDLPRKEVCCVRSEELVQDLKRYLEKNYHRSLKIGGLCVERYGSEQYICRRFRQIVGKSPKQYLMQLRLHHAARKLRTTEMAVYQAAFSCGFTDINNFCKQFRQCYGCSPSEYRQANAAEK